MMKNRQGQWKRWARFHCHFAMIYGGSPIGPTYDWLRGFRRQWRARVRRIRSAYDHSRKACEANEKGK